MTHKEKIIREASEEAMELLATGILSPEEFERKFRKLLRKVYDGGYEECEEAWRKYKNREFYKNTPWIC